MLPIYQVNKVDGLPGTVAPNKQWVQPGVLHLAEYSDKEDQHEDSPTKRFLGKTVTPALTRKQRTPIAQPHHQLTPHQHAN
jgi:hypothetical protein